MFHLCDLFFFLVELSCFTNFLSLPNVYLYMGVAQQEVVMCTLQKYFIVYKLTTTRKGTWVGPSREIESAYLY